MTTAVAAAPAAGATSTPATPSNGATSTTTEPARGTTSNTPTPKPGESAQAKPLTQAQKIKLKLKGKAGEHEREFTPAELERELQIAAHERSQRAEHLKEREAYDARMRKLQEDPDAFFQEAGVDIEAILAQRAERAQQMKTMTPEQRRIAELEGVLAKQQEAQQKAEQEAEAQRAQQEQQEFVQGNARLFGQVMKLAGLEGGTPFDKGSYLHSMAAVRQMALVAGEPDLTPEQLHAHTERFEQKQFDNTLARRMKNPEWVAKNTEAVKGALAAMFPEDVAPEAALALLGPKRCMAIVKAIHAKTRTSPVPIVQEPAPVGVQTHAQPNGKPPRDEWDVLDGLTGG